MSYIIGAIIICTVIYWVFFAGGIITWIAWTLVACVVVLWVFNWIYGQTDEGKEMNARIDEEERKMRVEAGTEGESSTGNKIIYRAQRPRMNFSAVIGMDKIKADMLAAGNSVKARGKGNDRNGIMLDGAPGNGKTMLAEALAGEMKLPFIKVSFSDIASRWINQTPEQLRKVFADAKAQAPCLLFIDEIDSIVRNRNNMTDAGDKIDTVNVALTELVDIRNSGVVVVAATNNPDMLDPAAYRDGRFDFKIEITAPDMPARLAIFHQTIAKSDVRVQVNEEALKSIMQRWDGFSAARIDNIAKEVVAIVKKQSCVVNYDLLAKALRNVQGRAGKLPTTALFVNELAQPAKVREFLEHLSVRMLKIEELESYGGKVPTGLLFHGLAGTGKTSAAMAIAKTAGWNFLSYAGADFISNPKKIEEAFRKAADLRPCVIFIDEADGLLADRAYSQHSEVTNKFLTVMEGTGGKVSDVLVIAATNYPEKMDEAALRGGRFTEKVEFLALDDVEIGKKITDWRHGLKLQISPELTDDVLLALLNGLAIADIMAVLQHVVSDVAARRLIDNGDPVIGKDDIQMAAKRVLA
jgi:transitional endoplasmic reticulum ATPase